MAIQHTPALGLPYPELQDAPLIASRDLRALAQKMDSEGAQIRGETTVALTQAERALIESLRAIRRVEDIEDPIYIGYGEPDGGQRLRVNLGADPGPGGEVTSESITDATTVGRAVLTAPLSVDARNAMSIFTGTRALLDAGTDTAERTWDAKELHEYVRDNAGSGGASTWDELTGKPTEFPSTVALVEGLEARLAAAEYDSGVLNIAPLVRPGYTVEHATLQRVGRTMTFSFEGLVPASNGSGFPFNTGAFPSGFRPPGERPFQAVATSGAACRMALRPAFGVGIYGADAGTTYVGTVTVLVPPALPTTLPGTLMT